MTSSSEINKGQLFQKPAGILGISVLETQDICMKQENKVPDISRVQLQGIKDRSSGQPTQRQI